MILSRVKPAVDPQLEKSQPTNHNKITFKDFIEKRDYTGALTILKIDLEKSKDDVDLEQWLAYCYFHLGDYNNAMLIYKNLSDIPQPKHVFVNLACCYFYLGMYPEAVEVLEKSDISDVKTRLQFHLAHKQGDEKKLMEYHEILADVVEDQLSLAAIHYLRSHYQEAIDIYKKLIINNRHFLALNVYMALCYYKLDFYDVSQEILDVYIKKYPDSMIITNLKACNLYKLYDGKAAEAELKNLIARRSSSFKFCEDLIKHNMVVFREGEGALQILPALVDILPEARLNLVVYYLRQGENEEAYELIKDLEPAIPQEYILKAIVNVVVGQEKGDTKQIENGQNLFNMVGSSSSECDTIPGRQCMASSLFLEGRYDEVSLYLSSIKSYFSTDDSFNFNFAQIKLALGEYKEAEEMYLQVKNTKIRDSFIYINHLTHCFVMNKKPQSAWDLYLKMENSQDSLTILQSIANDCYKTNQFWQSAKAFDMLERLDLLPEYWEGKRGACAGIFQQIVLGKQSKDQIVDVIQLLRNSSNSQVEQMIKMMKKWAKNNKMMDSLILEMEKLLASYRGDYAIQDIIGEFEEVNIDNLLTEADKLISETLPYFQSISINNKGETSKDISSIKINSSIKTAQFKYLQSDKKRVVFNFNNDSKSITIPKKHYKTSKINGKSTTINRCIVNKERQNPSYLNKCTSQKFKIPEVNFMKTQLQASSTILENHNQLHTMYNKHNKFTNNIKMQDQSNKLKMEDELNYYKSKNDELEKTLMLKEQEIHNLENRYEKLNQYCNSVLKKNIKEKFKNYDFQLNELIQRNMTRESQLHTIINNLLEEINQSHLQYRVKLSEKNKEICKYLDQIEKILDSVYKFRHISTIR